jgi:hypothetical protein
MSNALSTLWFFTADGDCRKPSILTTRVAVAVLKKNNAVIATIFSLEATVQMGVACLAHVHPGTTQPTPKTERMAIEAKH